MATAKKVKEVDKKLCDRFTQLYHDSGMMQSDFAIACGLTPRTKCYINEIGRYVIEPSKKVIVSLYYSLSVSPNYLLLGIGPRYITERVDRA